MSRVQHHRRKPDILFILYCLVGAALLTTLSVPFHLLDRSGPVDPGHSHSDLQS